ncbi:hypothetical protein, partial [Enterobacter hormaechei]
FTSNTPNTRSLVVSGGLGYVYKRQPHHSEEKISGSTVSVLPEILAGATWLHFKPDSFCLFKQTNRRAII